MPSDLKIRAANLKDYDRILEIFKSWAPDDWDAEYAERYYQDFFGNRHCCPTDEVFVGEIDGGLVGTIGYCPDVYETDDICWLNWFYLHKDLQRQGYGKQLLEYVIEILKAKKIRKIFVDTASYRFYQGAHKLYSKIGFKKEGVLKDYYGKGEHQIIMGMSLKK